MIKEINCETGEETVREQTAEELAQFKIDAEKIKTQKDADAAKLAARKALLNRLGITEAEASLLLP